MIAMNRLSRHLVYSCRGMICSNSPLAASAGLKALQEGGNAFDAALAVAATEAVTIVPACGLGGDAFILLYDAASGTITGINSSGVAATGATSAYYRAQGYQTMPLDGPHAIAVPGAVAAWEVVHRRFCSKSLAQLLDSAIGYAEDGSETGPISVHCVCAPRLGRASQGRRPARQSRPGPQLAPGGRRGRR
jgi:gamma-glutamyltranspeptidase/glutathione hydrolase